MNAQFLDGMLPQNAGTSFRADHGIIGMLQYRDMISNPNPQSSSRPALADYYANDRDFQSRHVAQIDHYERGQYAD